MLWPKKYLLLLPLAAGFFAKAQETRPLGVVSFGLSEIRPLKNSTGSLPYAYGFSAAVLPRIHATPWYLGITYQYATHNMSYNTLNYAYNGVPIHAEMDVQPVSNHFTGVLRREFILFKHHAGIVPYVEAGMGISAIKNKFRIYSARESSVTTNSTTSDTTYIYPDGYDNCVPYTPGGPVTQVITVHNNDYTTTVTTRETYETSSKIKNVTWHAWLGTGVNIGLATFNREKTDPCGLFLNLSAGMFIGGNLQYLDVSAPDPYEHHDHDHHSYGTKAYTVDFINPKTNEVHAHTVGYIRSYRLESPSVKIGLLFKF